MRLAEEDGEREEEELEVFVIVVGAWTSSKKLAHAFIAEEDGEGEEEEF